MINRLNNLIENHSEDNLLDFKKIQYPLGKNPKKHELLKDISAMANCLINDDKFIIIGVNEIDGKADSFNNIDELIDDANYQNYVIENITPRINFEYKSFNYNGFKLAYLRIFNNLNRPYLLKKEINNTSNNKNVFRIGDGFIRIGSHTKKMDRDDFDSIYFNKNEIIDRSNDLTIIPIYRELMDFELGSSDNYKGSDYLLIDFQILNKSSKKISFFYELIIEDLNQLFITKHRINEISNIYKSTLFNRKNLKAEEFEILESGNKKTILKKNITEIIIPSNSTSKCLFNREIVLEKSKLENIKIKLVLKGDEFKSGELMKELDLMKIRFNENKS